LSLEKVSNGLWLLPGKGIFRLEITKEIPMKKSIVAAAVLLLSQIAMADSVRNTVKSYEQASEQTCRYTRSSDYSFCLNYTCRYKKYFTCSNGSEESVLVLKINSFRVPGESPEDTVLETTVN
jgi:hypothetical protein